MISGTGAWVDQVLLAGPDNGACLELDRLWDRGALRDLIEDRRRRLAAAGLRSGGTVALSLPPSIACIANLLAAWRLGAQVALLDHRLTRHEVERALSRLDPQFAVEPSEPVTGALRGFHTVEERIVPLHGQPAQTDHILIQLSSGSTGPSKVIARTEAGLVAEIERYTRIKGFPRDGERAVVLASTVHVLGLVGGLLHSLHAGVRVSIPERVTAGGILDAIAAAGEPTTVIAVPFHAEILSSVAEPPELPYLARMVTGGEPVRAGVREAFTGRYRVPLGTMYGMTECGVIATDLTGRHPSALRPAPGMRIRTDRGELLLGLPSSPYLGAADPARWADGWLRTRDAGSLDPVTGRLTVQGRLDAQVSVGGLKVDLAEVEQTLASLPQVRDAVVLHGTHIEAYLALTEPVPLTELEAALAERLAAYKRPRALHVLTEIPRTATGKPVRDPGVLRAALTRQA